jgi:hypothetical protein
MVDQAEHICQFIAREVNVMKPIPQTSDDYVDFGEASFVKLMGELVEIKGYRAAAIMSCDGEVLYSNTNVTANRKNVSVMMGVLNDFCLVGIRLVVCIESLGNLALLQRRLEQLLPKIMKCLVWEPDNLVPLYLKERRAARIRAAALEVKEKSTVN